MRNGFPTVSARANRTSAPRFAPSRRRLARYRLRYALYKLDPNLQAAHRQSPWVLTWDDHEVASDYANDNAPPRRDPKEFLATARGGVPRLL